MKLFVWNCVDWASERYHNEGGIVVIAATLERAREMIAEITPKGDRSDGFIVPIQCGAITKPPDLERNCDGDEWIAVHPDAGCC